MQDTDTINIEQAETTAPAVEAPRNLYAALARAQANFAKVIKNRVNPAFKSRYADIEAILAAVRPALNAQGIFLCQRVINGPDRVSCETVLLHVSGEELAGGAVSIPLPRGSKNEAQALGSAITYARRYSLSATLGISADDDDDGNACAGTPAPAPAPAPVVVPPDLKARAEEAAAHGISAYQEFFSALEKAERVMLATAGMHAALKQRAEEASHA